MQSLPAHLVSQLQGSIAPGFLTGDLVVSPPDFSSLAGHAVIGFASSPPFRLENIWFDARAEGADVVLRSDSVSSIYAATLAGVGIALLPRAVADHDPGLVRIPTETSPEPRVVWQTVHRDLRSSARIRAVTDFLGEILGAIVRA